MKRYFRFIVAALVICVLLSASLLPASAAIGKPIATDDLENAGPGFTAVRATDKQKNINSVYQNSIFGFPFTDGDKTLKLASKADANTASYVISGNKSIYFENDPAKSGTETLSAMMTLPADGSPLEFKGDKVYIARFRMRALEKGSKLSVAVRTWDAMDDWITFQFNTDAKKGYSIKPTGNLRLYDKAAIQKVGDNDYEVALRFSGVNTQGAESYCFLMWTLEGRGGFAFDDMKIYESKDAPKSAFEIDVESDNQGSGSTNTPSNSGNAGNSGTTDKNEGTSSDKTNSGDSSQSDSTTDNDSTDGSGSGNVQSDINTVIKNDVQTVTIKKEAVTFTVTSIIFIIAAAVVLLGSVTYIVLTHVLKRR